MNHRIASIALFSALLLAALPAFAAEASFDRTLTATGRIDLSVATGAGAVHIAPGAPGQVHVVAHIRSNWGGSEDKVRDLAAHPPIEQTGNIVRIGNDTGSLHNIAIDYEIQAPPDTYLGANAGSGSIDDDGVGVNGRFSTGSGNIHATGMRGNLIVNTGSGNIYAELSGKGDVKAETGSGSIELRNVNGALRAQTGTGTIKAAGLPTASWRIETGSGSVEIWTNNTAFSLDAECGAGSIHSDRDIAVHGTQARRHIVGKVAGGGPLVQIHIGAGSIQIH